MLSCLEPPSQDPLGAFHSTKNSGDSGLGSEWNRHFPEFHSEILGVPREVGLKFRKIGITGKFRSIRPFLLGPSFSEPGNRNSTWLILALLMHVSMSSPSEAGWGGGEVGQPTWIWLWPISPEKMSKSSPYARPHLPPPPRAWHWWVRKHNTGPLSSKRLKYLTATLLQ